MSDRKAKLYLALSAVIVLSITFPPFREGLMDGVRGLFVIFGIQI